MKELSSEWWRRPGGKRSLQIHLNNATAGRESRGRRLGIGGGGGGGVGELIIHRQIQHCAICRTEKNNTL
jgi:endonuclease IV